MGEEKMEVDESGDKKKRRKDKKGKKEDRFKPY